MTPRKSAGATVVVRLTKKLAEEIDGVSLVSYRIGDLVHLDRHSADILVAEGWAEIIAEQMYIVGMGAERRIAADRSTAARRSADGPRRRTTDSQEPDVNGSGA
jgi:hypothetical protein